MTADDEAYEALRDAIRESEELEALIYAKEPTEISDSPPTIGAATLFITAMQHMTSMRVLAVRGDLNASVRALLRPMLESCFRATWIAHIAEPEEAEKVIEGERQMPMLSAKLAQTLDSHFDDDLYSWMVEDIGVMHGLTHSGYEQIIRHFDEQLGIASPPNKKECALIIERATIMARTTYVRIHDILHTGS